MEDCAQFKKRLAALKNVYWRAYASVTIAEALQRRTSCIRRRLHRLLDAAGAQFAVIELAQYDVLGILTQQQHRVIMHNIRYYKTIENIKSPVSSDNDSRTKNTISVRTSCQQELPLL